MQSQRQTNKQVFFGGDWQAWQRAKNSQNNFEEG